MLRVTALISALIAMQGAAMAQEPKQDTVEVHGKALVLSCAEWKRNENGSWTSTGPLLVGTSTLNEVTLRGKETKVLEDKCRNPSAPPAAPARSSDSTRHMRHMHGSAASAD